MKDSEKTKAQLAVEVAELRQQVAELSAAKKERQDLTGGKKAEKKLQEIEQIFSSIFQSAGDCLIFLSKSGIIQNVNEKADEIYGGPREELLGKHFSRIGIFSPRLIPEMLLAFKAAITGKRPHMSFTFKNKHGEEKKLECSAEAVRTGNKILGLTVAARDVTDHKQAEEEVVKFKTIADNAGYGVGIATIAGEFIYLNKSYAKMHGYTPEEVIGQNYALLYTEEQLAVIERIKKRLMETGGYYTQEIWHKRKDGTIFPTLMTILSIRDDHGKPLYTSAIVVDISERKKAEEALQESEERNRALLELGGRIGEAVVMLQDDERGVGMHVFTSEAWAHITGYSREELLNISMANLIHPRDREVAVERYKRRLRGEELPGLYELTIIRKDGTEVPVEVTYAFSHYHGRRVNVGYIRDISERKQAAEALQLRAQLLNNASDSIIAVDLDGNIIYANDTACRIHGYTKEEMLEIHLRDTVAPEQANLINGRIKKTIDEGHITFDSEHMCRDGSVFPVEVKARTVSLGEKAFILSVQRDITERKKAEMALRESEEFNSSVLRNSPNPVLVANPDTSVQYVNPALEELTGFSLDEIIGQKIPRPWWPEEMYKKLRRDFKSAFCHGFKSREQLFQRKNGERFWVQTTTSPVIINGEYKYFIANWVDITEQKQAEEALKESEEKYRLLVENQTDLVVKVNTEGEFQFVSPSYCEMFGMEEAELLGRKYMPLVHQDDREVTARAMENLYKPPHTCYIEQRALTKYGWHWLAWSDKAVLDKSNNLISVVGVGRDITERKKTEEALRESEERYRALIELGTRVGEAVVMLQDTEDKMAVHMFVNNEWTRITGYSREELLTMSIFDLYHPRYHKAAMERHKRRTRGEIVPELVERTIIRKDGTEVPLEVTFASTTYKGETVGVGYIREITERKKLEEERQRASRLESLSTLAGGIAHDFNNLLTGILGNMSLAKRYVEPDSKAAARLNEAERASVRAKDLTQQLLTFSRGGAPIKKSVSIGRLLVDATRFALRGSSIRPEFSLPDDLWPIDIDEGQINQVLTNLIINSEDAMPQGGTIQVSARNLSSKEARSLRLSPGKYIGIDISDHGVGILPEHLNRIFEPYFTTKQKGSGLGLATVYSIIRNHDAYITVESEVGTGTTFHIYLPASSKPVTGSEEMPADTPITGRGKILVMDDEDIIRDFLYHELTDIGYDVKVTSNGTEAVEQYRKAKTRGKPFQAVILDLTVSGAMGGKEAIKQLQEIDPKVKAIVSSGYANDPIMANYKKYGFRTVVTKPYRVGELEKALQKVLKPQK